MDRQLTDFCSCAFGRQSSERIHSPCRCSQRSVYIIEPGRHYTDKDAEYICGFSGSAGTAVVTLDKAALATDGRYFNQAEKQLDDNWTLLKQGLQDVPTWQEWSAEQSQGAKIVGVDPTTITARKTSDFKFSNEHC